MFSRRKLDEQLLYNRGATASEVLIAIRCHDRLQVAWGSEELEACLLELAATMLLSQGQCSCNGFIADVAGQLLLTDQL
jgi:hypothetical protein